MSSTSARCGPCRPPLQFSTWQSPEIGEEACSGSILGLDAAAMHVRGNRDRDIVFNVRRSTVGSTLVYSYGRLFYDALTKDTRLKVTIRRTSRDCM
jgi:hypothetical protein